MKRSKVEIVVSNSKTKETTSVWGKLIDFRYELDSKDFINIDITELSEKENKIIVDCLDENMNNFDIDIIFIENVSYPIFGNDFNYDIKDNQLIGTSYRKEKKI